MFRHFIQKALPLLALFACLQRAAAQEKLADFKPQFEHFVLPGDLTANSVQHIVQDSLGFLWFASEGGLHRYDGRSVVTYKFDPLKENCISDDYVEWIYMDRKGKMWLGHYGGGLTSFDRSTGNFKRFRHNPDDPQSLSDDWVSMILEDKQGQLWVATHNGLNRLDPATGKFKRFYHDPKNPQSLSHNIVRSLYVDSRGTLWVGCGFPWMDNGDMGGGLNRFDPKTETFTRYLHERGNPNSLIDNRVRTIFEDSQGNFWVGTMGDGLHLMNRETGKFTRLRNRHEAVPAKPFLKDHPGNAFGQVTFVFEDNRGWLWIGSFDGGLNIYDPKTKEMKHFEADFGRRGALQTNFIWSICQTKDGTIWLSSGTGGQMVFKIKSAPKVAVFQDLKSIESPKITVQAIAEDLTGKLWVGTAGGAGLLSFDPKTGRTSPFPNHSDNQNGNLNSQVVNSLATDKKGNLWVGVDGALKKVDPKSGKTERILPSVFEGKLPVGKTLEDRHGNIWIASYGEGVVRYEPKTGRHQRFQTSEGLGGNFAMSLLEDRFGNIWVGGGKPDKVGNEPLFLSRFDSAAQVFRNFKFAPPGEVGCVVQMAEDEEGFIWFTTALNGIRKLDPVLGTVKKYTVSNSSLPSNDIRSLVAAPNGKIWMSAKEGLIEFDPATETFYPYASQHGVTSATMIYGAGFLRRNGEVLFGSFGGFHKVVAEKTKPSHDARRSEPVVSITDFSLQNQLVEPGSALLGGQAIWAKKEIRLPFDHHLFAFSIACFDYIQPDANRLEYMLENYDDTWRTDLKDGQATYVNVPPGTYIFKVRGANSEGVWNTLGSEIKVVILPPWWKSWWAWSLWVLLGVAALYFGYKFQMKRRLAQAETERLRALDAAKSRLYTNITHEFRTPLTIILGMAKQVKLEIEKLEIGKLSTSPISQFPISQFLNPGLDMIERNGQNLLHLVNQLLDLAKLEDGKMNLNLVRSDVVSHLKYLVESFHSFAETKQIRLHFLSDLEALTMDFDAEKLQQVVSNLLSNAVKFTPEGGDIYMDLRMKNEEWQASGVKSANPQILVKVRDTGIGIPEAQLPHIFDRFYQVDDSATRQSEGSGIGLALTKELVKLMGGEISVKSRQEQGTEFQLSLPVKSEGRPAPASPPAPLKGEPNLAKTTQILEKLTSEPSYFGSTFRGAGGESHATHPTILLIEDNPDVVAYLAACLDEGDREGRPYRLAVAKDGQEGLEIATEIIPDLIVSDVMMPHKDGFEVCRFLKSDERTSHIPIILLTAKADQSSLLEGLETGADAYLAKPFHKEELLLRIRKLLELRETLQRRYRSAAGLTEAQLHEIDESPTATPVAPVEDYFLKKVRRVVEAHLDDCDFSVEELCREIGMSHSQLHRKLSALTGCSATKFIRRLRLQKAKELLQNEALSITSVAFDAGFNDPSYFSRVFKQEFGLTPAEWRDRQMLLADS